jgi:putative addiction module component (TIGR02574 family)
MDSNSSGLHRKSGNGAFNGSILIKADAAGDRAMDKKLTELPVEERIKLVEDLWDSIASDQNAVPVTPEQKAELNRRLDAYRVDQNPGRLASDVLAEIRRRL